MIKENVIDFMVQVPIVEVSLIYTIFILVSIFKTKK